MMRWDAFSWETSVSLPSHDLSKRVEFKMSLYLYLGSWFCSCACHGSPFPGSGQCAWQAATNGEDLSDLRGSVVPACLPGLLLWTSVSTQPVSHQDTHSFELLICFDQLFLVKMATIVTIKHSFSTSKRAIHTVAQFDISVAREKFWVAPFVAWGVAEKGGMAWDRHCGPARPLPSLHLMASVAQADLGMAARLLWLLLGKEAIVQAATVGLAPRNPSPFWVRGQTIWISKDRRRRTHSRTMPYPNRIPPSKFNDSRKYRKISSHIKRSFHFQLSESPSKNSFWRLSLIVTFRHFCCLLQQWVFVLRSSMPSGESQKTKV